MPAVIFDMYCCVQHYAENDLKLRRFVPIIQRSLVYPVILDARRTVLSLPPIINGAHSAVRAPQILCRMAVQACSVAFAMHDACSLAGSHCGCSVARV